MRMSGKWLVLCAVAVVFASFLGFANMAASQNAEMGRKIYQSQADCSNCHGWAGNGDGDDPRASRGANLRETILTLEEIAEVVLCGRPGTAMPHYDDRAYNDDRCYGLTREQLGRDTPTKAETPLVKRHADALAMFITEWFKGAGEVTFQQCVNLMGPESIRCDALRP